MSDVKSVKQISEDDRILGRAAPTLIPVLERRARGELATVLRIYGNPDAGPEDLRSAVGNYATVINLIRDLEVKLQNLQGVK